ncbi:MAG: restriction endonuclease subunit S [Myxococcaceae bacterium]|nr:MAG: restriction endonuclease subunit S [Myxococcaceae bacterium]
MSLPRYPAYKDSGVEWLGQVPAHWEVTPIGHRYNVQLGKMLDTSKISGEHLAPYLRVFDVQWGAINTQDLPTMDFSGGDRVKFSLRAGDLLVNEGGSYPGRSAIWTGQLQECFYQKALHRLRAYRHHEDSSKFLYYLMAVAVDQGVFVAGGNEATIEHLPAERFRRYRFPFPRLSEQTAITSFLDRETAKIDALMAEQQRLIDLLKEKRQAVISYAVTKGLNPDAPMKPSGTEWLGDVPAHWAAMPLKRDLVFLTSGSRGWADYYADAGALFIRIANLTRDGIGLDLSDAQRVEVPDGSEGSRTRVQTGDVLFSITAFLGSVAVVPEDLDSAYVSQHVALARLRQAYLSPVWVAYAALSIVGKTWFDTQSYGGTKIQLSLDDVRDLPLPVPPLAEQLAITAHLDAETARLDALTAAAQSAIDLLRERRAALISAVVTGQIDVRSLPQMNL